MGQGRVHWTANFDEVQDFERDMHGEFGGRGFMKDAELARPDFTDSASDTLHDVGTIKDSSGIS